MGIFEMVDQQNVCRITLTQSCFRDRNNRCVLQGFKIFFSQKYIKIGAHVQMLFKLKKLKIMKNFKL